MKHLFFSLAVLGFSYSFAGGCDKLKLVEATQQSWVSGAPGGRSGTAYSIKLVVKTGDALAFNNVWIGDENVPFNLERYAQETQQTIKQGDSLLLTYNRINGEPDSSLESKRLPIPYKGAALVEYTVNRKAYYLVVKTFAVKAELRSQ